MNRVIAVLVISCAWCGAFAADAEKPQSKNAAFEAIRSLAGTWVTSADMHEGGDAKPMTITFRATAGGNTVLETMAVGTGHEMLTVYSASDQPGDGGVTLTHYCHLGNQPHMRLTSAKDGVLNFEYAGAGNVKTRDEMHMDALQMTTKGDRLIETWSLYKDGKVIKQVSFELKRQ